MFSKIVIRRLPPTLTKEELEEQLQPLPEVDYLEFFSNDTRWISGPFHAQDNISCNVFLFF